MSEEVFSLAFIDNLLRQRRKDAEFPPALEARYVADSWGRRARRLRIACFRLAFVYNIFLVCDWFLTPDALRLSAAIHLLLVTPLIAFASWYAGRASSARLRDLVATSVPVAMCAQIVAVFFLTMSPFASNYLYFAITTHVGVNSVFRVPRKYAMRAGMLIFAMVVCAIMLRGDTPGEFTIAYAITYYVAAFTSDISNRVIDAEQRRFYLHSLRDRLAAEEAARMAQNDALTGIGNRRLLAMRAEALWMQESGASIASVVLLDIDHFKAFNDFYGHSAGDRCLKRIAAATEAALRNDADIAIRYGGEEFLLLLPDTDLLEAMRLAESLRRALYGLGIENKGHAPGAVVTGSFGVASATTGDCTLEQLVAEADTALYAAKRNGRNQVWPPLARPADQEEMPRRLLRNS